MINVLFSRRRGARVRAGKEPLSGFCNTENSAGPPANPMVTADQKSALAAVGIGSTSRPKKDALFSAQLFSIIGP